MGARGLSLAAAAAVLSFGLLPATAGAAGLPDREADPVVLTGADVPGLIGIAPASVVAFAHGGGWEQIPVQVDERAVVDYRAVRQTTGFGPFTHEAYTDPGTFAGADPDPTLDAGDEIAMMAKDAGGNASAVSSPPGVVDATRTAVMVSDPLNPGPDRFIYLFKTNSGLDPAAGKSYVDYDFSLNSGDYKTTYDWDGVANDGLGPPANTENSIVTTPFYSLHLLARWVEDQLAIKAGAATNADILDGDKAQVSFGCGRSELTFSRGGGGFIANKSGPVRAIRSYIGANSGTFTQQDLIYYERSQVMKTYLRVHAGINVIDQFLDYSPAASGMTYRTSADPAGVPIDGSPDAALETGNALGPQIDWEQATGPQGSLSIVSRVETDIPTFVAGSYYQDDSTPSTPQCGGYADDQAWGSSGPGISGVGVNTDPTLGSANNLTGTRTTFFSAPGADADLAARRSAQIDNPLEVTATATTDLELTVKDPKRKPRAGATARVPIVVENIGDAPARGVVVCGEARHRVATVGCTEAADIAAGRKLRTQLRVDTTRKAKRSVRVAYTATADNAGPKGIRGKLSIRR